MHAFNTRGYMYSACEDRGATFVLDLFKSKNVFTDCTFLNISRYKNIYAYFDIHVTWFSFTKECLLQRQKG